MRRIVARGSPFSGSVLSTMTHWRISRRHILTFRTKRDVPLFLPVPNTDSSPQVEDYVIGCTRKRLKLFTADS